MIVKNDYINEVGNKKVLVFSEKYDTFVSIVYLSFVFITKKEISSNLLKKLCR